MLLRSLRSTAIAFVLAASVVPLAACSGAATTSDPPATASNTTTGALNVNVHGPAKRVADALATVPLRADQRATLEQMAKDADTRMEPARKARGDFVGNGEGAQHFLDAAALRLGFGEERRNRVRAAVAGGVATISTSAPSYQAIACGGARTCGSCELPLAAGKTLCGAGLQ